MVAAVFSRLRLTAMLILALVGVAALAVGLVNAADRSKPLLAQAQVPDQRSGKTGNAEAKSPMTRCMESWQPATQMSKQEWKKTCERVVKENPELYSKPF